MIFIHYSTLSDVCCIGLSQLWPEATVVISGVSGASLWGAQPYKDVPWQTGSRLSAALSHFIQQACWYLVITSCLDLYCRAASYCNCWLTDNTPHAMEMGSFFFAQNKGCVFLGWPLESCAPTWREWELHFVVLTVSHSGCYTCDSDELSYDCCIRQGVLGDIVFQPVFSLFYGT